MSEAPTMEQFRDALLDAARQATAATFDMLEHHRDLHGDEHLSRFQNDVCEMLAEALGIALDIELAALERAIDLALTDMAATDLRQQQEMMGQLKGAVVRFVEGWAG